MKIAEKKKTFIMNREWVTMINRMTDEQAGKLLKAIYHFQTTGEEQEVKDLRVELALEYMIPTFEENESAWLSKSEQNRENGSKGGRPKKANASDREQTEKEKANASDREQTDADFAKKGVYGNGNGYGYVDGSEGESALLSAGGTVLSDSQKRRDEMLSVYFENVNRHNHQNFTLKTTPEKRREELWDMLQVAAENPYDKAEIENIVWRAYQNVCNNLSKMDRFTPMGILGDRLYEEE